MFERQTVLLRLPVAGQEQHRAGVGRLHAEEQIQEHVRIDVPVVQRADHIGGDSAEDGDGLNDQEGPGADAGGDAVGESLSETRLVVVQFVDEMAVSVMWHALGGIKGILLRCHFGANSSPALLPCR